MPHRRKVASLEELRAMFERASCAGVSRIRCNPSKRQIIWQVETTAIDIPKEFGEYHVRTFPRGPRELWTRNRSAAQRISALDRLAGGNPWPFPHDYRRCGYCGLRMIGLQAQIRQFHEAWAWMNGIAVSPCGCDCTASPTANKPNPLGQSAVTRFSDALGGCRAGSHGGKETTEQYERLDIRLLRRAGWHKAGSRFNVGGMQAHNEGSSLVLAWGDRSYCAIRLLRTGCNFGGVRMWLQCPQSDCGRRVGVLYRKGDFLACRQCLRLRYCSQREESGVRSLRRARALQAAGGNLWKCGHIRAQALPDAQQDLPAPPPAS